MFKFLTGFSVITCHRRTTLIFAFVLAAMYSIGLNNQARSPSVKAYLWRSIGMPSLMYAIGTCNISSVDLRRLESFQGTIIKNSVYLGKDVITVPCWRHWIFLIVTCMPFYLWHLFICDINVISMPSTDMNNSLFKRMCRWQRSLPVLMRIKPSFAIFLKLMNDSLVIVTSHYAGLLQVDYPPPVFDRVSRC